MARKKSSRTDQDADQATERTDSVLDAPSGTDRPEKTAPDPVADTRTVSGEPIESPGTETNDDATGNSDGNSGADLGADLGRDAAGIADTAVVASNETDIGAEPGGDRPPEDDAEAPAVSDADTHTDTDTNAEPQPEAEPEPETAPEPSPPATVEVVERVIEKRGGFLPALIGGIVAAGLGFAAASTDLVSPYLPASLQRPDPSAGMADLRAGLEQNSAAITDLRGAVEAVGAAEDQAQPDLSGIETRLSDLQSALDPLRGRISEIGDRLSDVEQRLADVEQRPLSEAASPAAIEAFERELAALQSGLAEQRAEVENMIADAQRMESEASETARQAAAQAALTQARSAIDAGAPFNPAIESLNELGVEVPEPLSAVAVEGVASLAALRDGFPEAARAALAEARAASSDADGLGGFLRRQLGARSVAPREGDDPDAVLSRAEAALEAGDIGAALSEIATLPESAQAELSDWSAAARARLEATAAADDLSQRLTAN